MPETYIVIFLLAEEAYSIPVACVQEIQGYHVISPPRQIPDTPPHFEGLIDLRGQVIPVLDLRRQLGLSASVPSRKTCYIIVDTQQEKVGLLVDSVVEVQRVQADAFQPPPERMKAGVHRDYILGVGQLSPKNHDEIEKKEDSKRLVIQLNIERLLDF